MLRGYGFDVLRTIPGSAPNAAQWTFDFEPGDINNNGDVIFTSNLTRGGSAIAEGSFLPHRKT
jgi:hypothetical protein